MMQNRQTLKAEIISTLEVLSVDNLTMLAEFAAFLRSKNEPAPNREQISQVSGSPQTGRQEEITGGAALSSALPETSQRTLDVLRQAGTIGPDSSTILKYLNDPEHQAWQPLQSSGEPASEIIIKQRRGLTGDSD